MRPAPGLCPAAHAQASRHPGSSASPLRRTDKETESWAGKASSLQAAEASARNPSDPAVGVLPNPRPQHADDSGARAPGSGAGDREVLGIREPRDTGALSPGAVPPAPGVLQCYFRCWGRDLWPTSAGGGGLGTRRRCCFREGHGVEGPRRAGRRPHVSSAPCWLRPGPSEPWPPVTWGARPGTLASWVAPISCPGRSPGGCRVSAQLLSRCLGCQGGGCCGLAPEPRGQRAGFPPSGRVTYSLVLCSLPVPIQEAGLQTAQPGREAAGQTPQQGTQARLPPAPPAEIGVLPGRGSSGLTTVPSPAPTGFPPGVPLNTVAIFCVRRTH